MLQLAFDIGGTFTDLVLLNTGTGHLDVWKVPTTPDAPDMAVARALAERVGEGAMPAADVSAALHPTTVPTQALLRRHGARTALIPTRLFRRIRLSDGQRQRVYSTRNTRRPAPCRQKQPAEG